MSTSSNKKKAQQLGMPPGTANGRLRKKLLFHLVKQLNQHFCYRCNKKIISLDEFSIEHIQGWLDSKNPVELFFDLNNISFSHLKCNILSSRTSKGAKFPYRAEEMRIKSPIGKCWCNKHKDFSPVEEFSVCTTNWTGYEPACKRCRRSYRKRSAGNGLAGELT